MRGPSANPEGRAPARTAAAAGRSHARAAGPARPELKGAGRPPQTAASRDQASQPRTSAAAATRPRMR
eukprot:11487748-Alexandrium_andersonii.AAC.1